MNSAELRERVYFISLYLLRDENITLDITAVFNNSTLYEVRVLSFDLNSSKATVNQ